MKQRPRRFARKGAERRYVPGFRRKHENPATGKLGAQPGGHFWLHPSWDKHPRNA